MGKYKKYKIRDLEFGDELGRDELLQVMPPDISPVHIRALVGHQTLHLCMSERLDVTRHFTCAYQSARGSPDASPVHV